MKRMFKALIIVAMLAFTAVESHAQVIVRVRPVPQRVAVVPRPGPRHVWVREEWVPVNGRYVWHGGYWAAPPRPRAIYVQGHWRHGYRGWVWVPGYWR